MKASVNQTCQLNLYKGWELEFKSFHQCCVWVATAENATDQLEAAEGAREYKVLRVILLGLQSVVSLRSLPIKSVLCAA